MTDEKRPNIPEKVRFWEEQDKINQALIPRVIEMHEVICDLQKRATGITSQIAAAEARVLQRVQKQLTNTTVQALGSARLVAYSALALSAFALAISLYLLFT